MLVVDVDPFKIWDLASGKLRLSLTGHVSAVRACKVSHRHPFLFTGGEDKQVRSFVFTFKLLILISFVDAQIFIFTVEKTDLWKILFRVRKFLLTKS